MLAGLARLPPQPTHPCSQLPPSRNPPSKPRPSSRDLGDTRVGVSHRSLPPSPPQPCPVLSNPPVSRSSLPAIISRPLASQPTHPPETQPTLATRLIVLPESPANESARGHLHQVPRPCRSRRSSGTSMFAARGRADARTPPSPPIGSLATKSPPLSSSRPPINVRSAPGHTPPPQQACLGQVRSST